MPRAGRLALVLLALLGGAAAAPAQEPPRRRALPAVVVRVLSGDAINAFVNGEVMPVRYIGIASPAPGEGPGGGEPQGREALAFNRALVNQKNVRLELDAQEHDAEGHLLAYVWVGDVLANAEVVGHGYGEVVTGGANVRHQELLLRRQQEAFADCYAVDARISLADGKRLSGAEYKPLVRAALQRDRASGMLVDWRDPVYETQGERVRVRVARWSTGEPRESEAELVLGAGADGGWRIVEETSVGFPEP